MEIIARCCRVWVDEDTVDQEAVQLAVRVMKAGMAQLPNDPYMILLYSSFLIDVQTSYQSGYTILQNVSMVAPSPDAGENYVQESLLSDQ